MPREKSAGALVFHNHGSERKFLLLLYGAGHWDFPKGHIEAGETEKNALFRELEEETGLAAKDLKILPGFREEIQYFYRSNAGNVSKQVVFFLAESKHDRVKISFEHKGFKWLFLDKAIETATFKTAKQLLSKAGLHLANK